MTTSAINKLDNSYYNTESATESSKTSESSSTVGKDEFLQLLITQLQNQDPLNPVENEEFAVNLAQFSQVEQLISINDTLEGISSSSSESEGLATYLGHQVLLNDNTIEVTNNDGGEILFKIPLASSDVNIQLLDSDKNVVETVSLGELEAGEYTTNLNNLTTSSGSYSAVVSYLNSSESYSTVDYSRCGTVSGFIPGGDTPLLIGDQQISLSDIKEVRA